MSEKRGPRGRLEEQVEAAERFLVLRNFEEADRVSRYVMQKATSVPDSKNQLQRAASVLLQAMFELNRCCTHVSFVGASHIMLYKSSNNPSTQIRRVSGSAAAAVRQP